MNQPIFKLSGYKTLAYVAEKLVVSRLNKVFITDLNFKNVEYVCTVGRLNLITSFFSRFRLFQRLFRLELGPATTLLQHGCILVFFKGELFHIDVNKRLVTRERLPNVAKRPLQMLMVQSKNSAGAVLFGEYQSNFGYEPVNIYRRDSAGLWEIAYVFPKGAINHVHGIYENIKENSLYILTGDFEQGACIWRADAALKVVTPLLRSGQMSRACWVATWENEVIYATDQQAEINYLCSIDFEETPRIRILFPIAGSSIYFSVCHKDNIAFSTAVEPNSSNKISLRSLISTRRADGIISDNACIYFGNPSDGFRIIFSGAKDWLPYALFQFGSIYFPTGISPDQTYIHFYCTALKGHDGTSYAIKL